MEVTVEYSLSDSHLDLKISCGPLHYTLDHYFTDVRVYTNNISLINVKNRIEIYISDTVCTIYPESRDCRHCDAEIECPEDRLQVPLQNMEKLLGELRLLAK